MEAQLCEKLYSALVLEKGDSLASRPGNFTAVKETRVTSGQETGWATWPVWTLCISIANLARFLCRPARSTVTVLTERSYRSEEIWGSVGRVTLY